MASDSKAVRERVDERPRGQPPLLAPDAEQPGRSRAQPVVGWVEVEGIDHPGVAQE
jgi:hypothetical protein